MYYCHSQQCYSILKTCLISVFQLSIAQDIREVLKQMNPVTIRTLLEKLPHQKKGQESTFCTSDRYISFLFTLENV